jgi:hypothetical protein
LSRGNQPSSSTAAVAPAAALNGARMYEPIDSGDVGLITRSMCRNRSGPAEVVDQEHDRGDRRATGDVAGVAGERRPVGEVGQRRHDRRGAGAPPEEEVQRHVRRLPHRRLDDRPAVVGGELGLLDHRHLAAGTAPARRRRRFSRFCAGGPSARRQPAPGVVMPSVMP